MVWWEQSVCKCPEADVLVSKGWQWSVDSDTFGNGDSLVNAKAWASSWSGEVGPAPVASSHTPGSRDHFSHLYTRLGVATGVT